MSGGLLVALVDDDESIRESLPPLLTSFGFAVVPFLSAEEFLAQARLERIRSLVLDVGLPGMSGPQLHRELLRRAVNIPVIFITARASDEFGAEVLESGAVACLTKPFSESDIVGAVRSAMAASGEK